MKRLAVLLIALAFACGGAHKSQPGSLAPVSGYDIPPSPVYQMWAAEVVGCALHMSTLDTSFVMDTVALQTYGTVEELKWSIVPSEKADGTFACTGIPNVNCYGEVLYPRDEAPIIRLSAMHIGAKWLIKHEILHIFVKKDTEHLPKSHGAPWGVCEWL